MSREQDQRQQIIRDLVSPYMTGEGSPTKAEINSLVQIFRGDDIPDEIAEAVLLTTNPSNRKLVNKAISSWNETPPKVRGQLGPIAMGNLQTFMSNRGIGFIDTSALLRVNMQRGFQAEVAKGKILNYRQKPR